jgi:hypothetical protein
MHHAVEQEKRNKKEGQFRLLTKDFTTGIKPLMQYIIEGQEIGSISGHTILFYIRNK